MKDDLFEYVPIYDKNKQIGVFIYEIGITKENAVKILIKDAITNNMHRILTPEEELEFRKWARDNYKVHETIQGSWHPIIVDECNKMVQEYYQSLKDYDNM